MDQSSHRGPRSLWLSMSYGGQLTRSAHWVASPRRRGVSTPGFLGIFYHQDTAKGQQTQPAFACASRACWRWVALSRSNQRPICCGMPPARTDQVWERKQENLCGLITHSVLYLCSDFKLGLRQHLSRNVQNQRCIRRYYPCSTIPLRCISIPRYESRAGKRDLSSQVHPASNMSKLVPRRPRELFVVLPCSLVLLIPAKLYSGASSSAMGQS